LREHGISLVRIPYQIDGHTLRDGELTPAEFYSCLRAAKTRPSTQAPSPGEILSAFRRARESGADGVVCITLPDSYSGTFRAAVAAEELGRTDLPDFPIRVVDSGGLAMVHGFAVLAAAWEACRGGDPSSIATAATERAAGTRLVGALESTHYLAKSGRVPLVLHWAASALHIRPIFAAEGTKTRSVGRSRTAEGAVEQIIEYIEGNSTPGDPIQFAVMHADAPDRAERLADTLRDRFNAAGVMITEFTPVMAIHTGPGLLAVAFYAE
jgi:DegV family protein with EDD domain